MYIRGKYIFSERDMYAKIVLGSIEIYTQRLFKYL